MADAALAAVKSQSLVQSSWDTAALQNALTLVQKHVGDQHQLYILTPVGQDGRSMRVSPITKRDVGNAADTLSRAVDVTQVQEVVDRARELMRLSGLDVELSSQMQQRGHGSMAAVISVGPQTSGASASYVAGLNFVSLGPIDSVSRSALHLVHELAHQAIQYRNSDRRPTLAGAISDEANSYAFEFAAAYAMHLKGVPGYWPHMTTSHTSEHYRTVVEKAAGQFPDLKAALEKTGTLPPEFVSELRTAFAQRPTAHHLGSFNTLSKDRSALSLPGSDAGLEKALGTSPWAAAALEPGPGTLLEKTNSISQRLQRNKNDQNVDDALARFVENNVTGAYDAYQSLSRLGETIPVQDTARLQRLRTLAGVDAYQSVTGIDLKAMPGMSTIERRALVDDQRLAMAADVARAKGDPNFGARSMEMKTWAAYESFLAARSERSLWAGFLMQRLESTNQDFSMFNRQGETKTSAQIAAGIGILDAVKDTDQFGIHTRDELFKKLKLDPQVAALDVSKSLSPGIKVPPPSRGLGH